MLHFEWVAGNPGFNRQAPVAQMPGCPGGTPQLVLLAEAPGATLDAHRLHAASVLFCKCGLPPLFTCCARRRFLPCSSNVIEV